MGSMICLLLVVGMFPGAWAKDQVEDFNPQLAKQMFDDGALLIDVRTEQEYKKAHITGAINIPIQEFDKRIDEVTKKTDGKKEKPIVVYCAAGGRASKAKKILTSQGFSTVSNLGGLKDWPEKSSICPGSDAVCPKKH